MDATAVARPYAAAAFAHAQQNDAIVLWQQALACLAQAAQALNQAVAGGSLISSAEAAAVVLEVAEAAGGLTEEQKRFVGLLAENDRIFALPSVSSRFDELRREAAGVVLVRVESALPIDDREGFNRYLETRLGKKSEVTYEENSELLGGVRIYVNDDVIDASIRGRLERLAATLTAGAAIHSA